MIDAVDAMIAKQATALKAEIERRQALMAELRADLSQHESELSVLRGKLADIAGIAPIPPDTKVTT